MEPVTAQDELEQKMSFMGFREQDILMSDVPLSEPTDYFFNGTHLRVTRSPSFVQMVNRLQLSSAQERELYRLFRRLVPEVGDNARVLGLHVIRLKNDGSSEKILATY